MPGRAMTQLDLLQKYDRAVPRYTSYPTAPHFHAEIGPEQYAAWLAAGDATAPVSLYLHVPYCKTMCWYCGCHTKVAARYQPVEDLAARLIEEVALVARHVDARRPATQIHWGGGTPNMLRPAEFARIMAALDQHFPRADTAEVAIEMDPRLLTQEMAAECLMSGVTRVSLGVQDFDPEVQRLINREQPFALVRDAVELLRAHGIAGINLDLMYGLPGQTRETILKTIDLAHALAPDRLALFGYAHVPWMKTHQRLIDESRMPDAASRWDLMSLANDRLRALGYVQIGFDHFARADDPMVLALKAGKLTRNFQGYAVEDAATLIGLGPSAIGTLPQGYVQNLAEPGAWHRAVAAGRLATARGIALSDEDRLRRAIIERLLCDFAVDLDAVARAHGMSGRRFGPEKVRLNELVADGLVELDGERVRITEPGRPLARLVAACFDSYLETGKARHSKAV
ncbi:MAG TPA: oxygen-independent coproporphyrinogen III oxidase [Alphaproteobacteria bacterium]|nr:oxygen-independent coproporphyrinogen III oxidase [Alphaproteobacteria bacterium]